MSFVSFILPAEVSIEEKLNSSPPFSWHQSIVLLMSSCRVFISMLWISMQMLWIVMQMLRIPYKNCGLPHKLLRIQSGRWRGYVLLLQTPKYGCVLHHFPIYVHIYFTVWHDNSSDDETVARRSDGGLTDGWAIYICTFEWQRLFGGGLMCCRWC